jgi:endoglucanase
MRFYCLLLCLGAGWTPLAQAGDGWQEFQERFVAQDGRIVDTGQGGISHSEGQGAGMLFAEAAGDQVGFNRIWEWTRQHLQVRDDGLLAWRWTTTEGATDRNNATDGDLLVAWALVRAHNRWQKPEYLRSALAIAQDLRKKAIRPSAFGPLVLPGLTGFERPDGMVINLSYWIFPALQALSHADPSPEWAALQQSGLALLGANRFGRWQLPADWVVINNDKLALAEGFPGRFGYDAIRIPLYLY